MIVQEVLKIVRRRGMFWCTLAVPLVFLIGILITRVILTSANEQDHPYLGGETVILSDVAFGVALVTLVMAILMGAQAGAWDEQFGTMRYLVLTGRSSTSLVLARIPGYLIAFLLATLPTIVLLLAAGFLLEAPPGDEPTLGGAADALRGIYISSCVFGLISFAVGTLLRSQGAAIAVSLVLNLAGLQLISLVTLLSERLGDFTLPIALAALLGDEDAEISVWGGGLVVLGWMLIFLVPATVRVSRTEY